MTFEGRHSWSCRYWRPSPATARTGQTRSIGDVRAMSAYPPTPDVLLRCRERSKGATNGLMHRSKRGTPVEKPHSITSSAPTRPGRRNPTTSKAASVFSPDRCRCNRASTEMNLLRICRDECHKAIPVRHRYLRQCLGIHCVVLSDDAVELQDIGGYCIEFVIGQRFRFVVRH